MEKKSLNTEIKLFSRMDEYVQEISKNLEKYFRNPNKIIANMNFDERLELSSRLREEISYHRKDWSLERRLKILELSWKIIEDELKACGVMFSRYS